MKHTIGLVLLVLSLSASAQKPVLRFTHVVQGGLLEGDDGSAFQLQTVQGISYKTWKAGIGAGLDYYFTRSLPLFLDLRKAFSAGPKSAFVYVEGGYNFPWLTASQKLTNPGKASDGLFYDAGLGYSFPVKQNAIFFSAGYSYKAYRSVYEYTVCPFVPPCYTQTERYSFDLRRLSVKTGFSF